MGAAAAAPPPEAVGTGAAALDVGAAPDVGAAAVVAGGAVVALCVVLLADVAVAGAFAELAFADALTLGAATEPPTDADAAGAFAVALPFDVV